MSYELRELEEILESLNLIQQADIVTLKDDKGLTLLLKAASQNYFILVDFLVNYGIKKLYKLHKSKIATRDDKVFMRNKVKQIIKVWINVPAENNQGFTALHYASFFGNPKMIKLLIQHGADIHSTNTQKLTMLHLAAQGDQPYSLTYFRDLGLDIN